MSALVTVLASGDGAPLWILAAGPAGALGTYWAIYRYYRNTDKSHAFERDTLIEAQPVQGHEEKVDHISRTRDPDIDGDNSAKYRERVRRLR
ncbi:hypothetical protein KDN32_09585 [Nocardioides sp. J2M5]|uniref:hypothetical protein n=1 Tax=Nocardioides palaemonis TaxID=2829810 RepID=UPI001BA9F28F|nr:hypothetical protein [Nocardioides palaemonis]MBS2937991.1 hypothetical protein [Nocardioides palaemonis]